MSAAFLAPATLFSQWKLDVVGMVKKEEDKKRMEGAVIEVYRNGNLVNTITTPSDGKFTIPLDPDGDYKLNFTKPGHVSKNIFVSTKGVNPEDAKYGFEFPMEMNLFEEIPGLDVSILKQPLAKIRFDPNVGYFDYDVEYTKSIQKEIDRLKDELAARLKEEEEKRKKREAEYAAAISAADKAYSKQDWQTAKTEYNKAKTVKPNETYPQTKLDEIQKILDKDAAAQEQYLQIIAKADKAFNEQKYADAKAAYNEALAVKPRDEYPINKLKEIETLLAQQQQLEADYKNHISKGDAALVAKKYEEAKSNFNSALGIKSNEQYPKDKLAEIEAILAELNKEQLEKEKREKEYQAAIRQGDQLFSTQDWEHAKAAYQEAEKIKPEESYPKTKIKEIDDALANAKALDEQYKGVIAKADQLLAGEKWNEAKTEYQNALNLKPKEQYPATKISEIEAKLSELAEKEKAEKEKEKQYNELINKGDFSLENANFEDAKTFFTQASAIKENEQYPKDKIAQIDKILAELAAKQKEQAELDKQYNNLIAKADQFFKDKNYAEAKNSYQFAADIKDKEQYPKDKLAEIEKILTELAAKEKAEKELTEKYNSLIAQADADFGDKNYDKAKSSYQEAAKLKPEEQYPKDKIKAIDDLLANLAVDEKYNNIITEADRLLASQNLESAKDKYNEALVVKSTEQYPKDKIKEIEALIAKKKEEEQIAITMAKKDEEYDRYIQEADRSFGNWEYELAKSAYEKALVVKPDEQYPKTKIEEIDKILAEKQKELEAQKEKELAEKQKEQQYKDFIAKADGFFASSEYEKAKENYNSALGIKPIEVYPKQKIEEIDKILAKIAAEKAEKETLEKQYNDLIAKADIDFGNENYEAAKKGYQFALDVKPKESYPKQKIDEINKKLEEITKKEKEDKLAAEAEQKKREYYQALIAQADGEFAKKEYDKAKGSYVLASSVMPDKDYPKQKISEIEQILKDLANQENNQEKIEIEMAKKDEEYRQLIVKADGSFGAKNYEDSKSKYQEALGIKPNEQYPKDQIAKIDRILAEIEAEKLANQQLSEQEKALNEQYKNLITQADAAFSNKEYQNAISIYTQANNLKPLEKYPPAKISEIEKILAQIEAEKLAQQQSEAEKKLLDDNYNSMIAEADGAFDSESYNSAIFYYKEALKLKPAEVYPKNRIDKINMLLAQKDNKQNTNNNTNDNVVIDYGPSKSIDDKQEKEIEKMLADLAKKREEEKTKSMQEYIDAQNQQQQDMIKNAEDRRKNNFDELLAVNEQIIKETQAQFKEHTRKVQQHEDFSERVKELEEQRMEKSREQRKAAEKELKEIQEKYDQLREDRYKKMLENDKVVVEMQKNVTDQQNDLIATQQRKTNNAVKLMEQQEKSWQEFLAETRERHKEKDNYFFEVQDEQQEMKLAMIDKHQTQQEINQRQVEKMQKDIADKVAYQYQLWEQKEESVKTLQAAVDKQQQDLIQVNFNKTKTNAEKIIDQRIDQQRMAKNLRDNAKKGDRTVEEQEKAYQEAQQQKIKEHQQKTQDYNQQLLDYAKQLASEAAARSMKYQSQYNYIAARQADIDAYQNELIDRNKAKTLENVNVTYYRGEEQPKNSDLAKVSSQGVTEKKYEEGNAIILERIVVKGEKADVYKKIHYTWGGVYYTKNDRNITEALWNTETLGK